MAGACCVKSWLHGLGAAFVSGLSDAFLLHMADPEHFNLTPEGLKAMVPLIFFKALFAVALYLKKSPLPE